MNHAETEIDRRMQDDEGFLAALRDARLDALRRHSNAGVPVVVWQNREVTERSANLLLTKHQRQSRSAAGDAA